jgi:hypothetical protein
MDSSSRPKGSHPQDRTACPAEIGVGPGFHPKADPRRSSADADGIASDQPRASGDRDGREPIPAVPRAGVANAP